MALWSMLDLGAVDPEEIAEPTRVSYAALAKVHTPKLLQALSDPALLAPIFGATADELQMDNAAATIRLACGATVEAARRVVDGEGPQVNLLGGFHHASPNKGGGFSVVNDIAVAIREVRDNGFDGTIAVLDLDAHPPDGTADCVAADPLGMGDVWIGSISGSDWGGLAEVDETLITGANDSQYLAALDGLLRRMPDPDLTFVLAGGVVLEQDRFGGLSLSVAGALQRDERVFDHVGERSVWLSAGGYSDDAWKVLLNTVAVLALRDRLEIPPGYDPLRARYSKVARQLQPPTDDEAFLTDFDLAVDLGMRPPGGLRLLDVYTPEWIEQALEEYGALDHIERLGYSDFRAEVDRAPEGDRLRLYGMANGKEHVLIESVVERKTIEGDRYLFVNWLTLRHPIADFTKQRPRLPNQEVPGLGLAREAGELLARVAERLGLAGVAVRPAAFHVAYTARYEFSFVDPEVQGCFEQLIEDLGDVPLPVLTRAIADERVELNGEPFVWTGEPMVARLDGKRTEPAPCPGHFELVDEAST